MRLMDIMLAIPGLLLAIGIVAVLGPGITQIMVAVGVTQIPIFARLLRGSILAQKENDFVLAARAVGVPTRTILASHILPNAVSPVIVQATLALATAIIDVAGLGFLGLGPQDPSTPEWGTMLTDTTRYLQTAPYLALIPGAAIVLSVLGFNLIGDGLREALDPKLRGRARCRSRCSRCDDLEVAFWTSRGIVHAVNGISFDIAPGETLGIVGESGCGKSVTSLALLGILPRAGPRPTGTALFDGPRPAPALRRASCARSAAGEIAMIFQDPMTSLNPVLTIGRQIREALEAHFDMDEREREARAVELLDQVGIPSADERLGDYPHQFSGGMRQRAMIAMALACEPKLLIADEPTTALDVTIQAQILDLLRELVAERDTALILITHDLGVVAGMCERVQRDVRGHVRRDGSAEQLFAQPRHPYTLGLLAERAAARRGARQRLHPIEGAPRNMLQPAERRARSRRAAATRSSAVARSCRRSSELERRARVACFNPVPTDEWQRTRGRDGRVSARRERPLVEVDELKVWFPIRSGRRPRSARRRRQGRRRRLVLDRRGETLGLVGESGCGKSTLGRAILRLVRADRGRDRFDGSDITRLRRGASCGRCGGGCRWSSRTRSRR